MKEKLNENIVMLLQQSNDFIKAEELAVKLEVNEKTVRRRIRQLNETFNLNNIGIIEAKKSKGYKLYVYNKSEFDKFIDYKIADIELNNPLNRRASIFFKIDKI